MPPFVVVGAGMVDPAVGPPALGSLAGAPGDRLRDGQQVPKLEDEVPAGVEGSPAAGTDAAPAGPELGDPLEGGREVTVLAVDADQRLHRRLEVALERVRIFAINALEWRRELPG